MLESRSRAYCEQRIRAGVLEHGTVELLEANGVGERMRRDGLVHRGIYLRFAGRSRHIDFPALTGKTITVYGQHEVVKDLIAAHLASGEPLHFDVSDVSVHGIDGERPSIRYRDASGEAARDRVRRRRGMRRVSRHRARRHPRRRADGVRARLPVRVARHPLGLAARVRGADLRAARPRFRAVLAALAVGAAHVPAVRARRGSRAVARPAHLGRAAPAARRRRCSEPRGRSDHAEGRDGDAQLRRRADAVRPAVPRGRRGAHRAADGREGHEPRGRRRRRARARARRVLRARRPRRARRVLRDVPAARVARRALLVVDDVDAAPPAGRRTRSASRLQLAELDYVTSSRAASQSLAENYVGLPLTT